MRKVEIEFGGQKRELLYNIVTDRRAIEQAAGKTAWAAFTEGVFGAPAGIDWVDFNSSFTDARAVSQWFVERADPEAMVVYLWIGLRHAGELTRDQVRAWLVEYCSDGDITFLAKKIMDSAYLHALFNVRYDLEAKQALAVLAGKVQSSSEPSESDSTASSAKSQSELGSTDAQPMA